MADVNAQDGFRPLRSDVLVIAKARVVCGVADHNSPAGALDRSDDCAGDRGLLQRNHPAYSDFAWVALRFGLYEEIAAMFLQKHRTLGARTLKRDDHELSQQRV